MQSDELVSEKVEVCLDRDLLDGYYLHSRDLGFVSPTFETIKTLETYITGVLRKSVSVWNWIDLIKGKYVYI